MDLLFAGNLAKMKTEFATPVQYTLVSPENNLAVNSLIGRSIQIRFNGRINCVSCGVITKKAFGQGFCYKCFISSPDNSECIVRPELCRGHLGEGRDPEWELKHHVMPHSIYLTVSSGLKVGVTRSTQIPTRWIDQGSTHALVLAQVPYRMLAGSIEVALKPYVADKTHWMKMLRNEHDREIDLIAEKTKLSLLLPPELQEYVCDDNTITTIEYPVLEYPTKVKSINLEKTPQFEGRLFGIKGQYLIFEEGLVFNIRNSSGYFVEIFA